MRFRRALGLASLPTLLLVLCSPSLGTACQTYDEYSLTGCVDFWTSAYVRLPQTHRTLFNAQTEKFFTTHADIIEFNRSEFHVTLDQQPARLSDALGFPISWHLELRPWYDSTYDLPDTVGQGRFHQFLADQLETNVNGRMADNYDPLFREYYVDLRPPHFFIRLGRQIIAWGKSDGVYMLDIVNNFNLVNPEIFNEQNIKIPEWAANVNYNVTAKQTVQLLFIPQYLPTYYAGIQIAHGLPQQGGYGDFTYNSTANFNNFLNGSFGFKVPTSFNLPSTRLNNWVYGARWSDDSTEFHYTLNYLYTWTTSMIGYPSNTATWATATTGAWRPHRMHVAGGSVDYDVNTGNAWTDGTVFRVESAVTTGDVYYEGLLGQPVDVTHWGLLGAVDKTILSSYLERPIFFSFQYWQDYVLRRNNYCACGGNDSMFQDAGFYGSKAGMRGLYKSISTLFLDKTWLSGDFWDTNVSVVYEWQFHDWWIKPQVTYMVNDKTSVDVGFDIFAGGFQTPYGEFTNNSNIYAELHRVLW